MRKQKKDGQAQRVEETEEIKENQEGAEAINAKSGSQESRCMRKQKGHRKPRLYDT